MSGLRSVDLNIKPSKMKIQLAKPSGTQIGIKIRNIVDFSNPSLTLSLGRLNEISFTIPYKVERSHDLVDNEVVSLIRNRYLLKVQWNNVIEWFIINELSDSVDGSSEGLAVHAFSLGHELADKLISQLSNEAPVTPQTILTDALSPTNWSIGTIDERIVDKYRSFDVSETTVLDFLSTIADTYGAILVFDSENRKISLVHPDNYKINRGFRIAYGQYLQSLSRTSNSDDMTTRLTVTGKDGLGINSVNPTGAGYIESFAYFMYPFEAKVGTWKDIETKKWSEL
ncbi:phage tail spike protein [uncultured Metabacillus sp.]|uniref:phage tail spike protein n=1 Tax=uncultured Metabacillus sp. TaxID=2860135 RepID=UPI00263104FC|nr:phage tail spike protein [uncultured Metabacillus sp.]